GKTILLTTHYMHEAETLCDRLLIMNKGVVIAEGTPRGLRERFTPGYVAVFAQGPRAAELREAAARNQFHFTEDSSGIYIRAAALELLLRLQKDLNCAAT